MIDIYDRQTLRKSLIKIHWGSFGKIADLISSSLHFDRILANDNGKPSNFMIFRSRGGDFLKNLLSDPKQNSRLLISTIDKHSA